MPVDESMAYLELKGKLENLSKGIEKHSADKDYPANISAAAIDEKLAALVQKRKAFTDASSFADQKSDEYAVEAAACEDLFSRVSTQLYGLHGKQNLVVQDYGLKIWQKHGGRKSKGNNNPSK